MTTGSAQPTGCLKSFWQSLETSREPLATSSSFMASSWESSSQSVNWMIENRGGLAKVTGLMIVPSQFLGPDHDRSQRIIDRACEDCQSQGYIVEKIRLPHKSGELEGVIYYPPGWDRSDNSRCVVYHNPNGITVPQFFEDGRLSLTAGEVLNLKKCPIILYDYRGTGLNQGENPTSSFQFRPTYETIVEDGLAALRHATQQFKQVDIWGSSLGGGVATTSLERHLSENPGDVGRVSVTNHDSFTTTPRVVLPTQHWIADSLGWLVGGNVDAQTPMRSLIDRGVKVTVLCHQQDPVIPQGARMAEFVSQFEDRDNVSLVYSPHYGHANLSMDMLQQLV